ncbi:uncharacterized protein LOC134694949 [Mytilus trossulus]|uniref:uncharacterized protein LOC134694949 n=1 Tax=Mytilus trossulus TaxID=6551 RepID=UPI0030073BED
MSAMHSVVWLFYCSMSFAICAADGKTNVQIPLLNNKATAPLYAEFNMSNLNQRLREIFNKEVIENTVNVSCEEPYEKIGKGCYSIKDDNVSGDAAFASCTNPGAYLANFETIEEAMIMKLFLQKRNSGIHYYVGGRNINRYLPNGDWRWIKHGKATKMTYFAFAFNQGPDSKLDSENDCMFFYARYRYKFHDNGCDNGKYLGGYICEI